MPGNILSQFPKIPNITALHTYMKAPLYPTYRGALSEDTKVKVFDKGIAIMSQSG